MTFLINNGWNNGDLKIISEDREGNIQDSIKNVVLANNINVIPTLFSFFIHFQVSTSIPK